MVLWPSFARTRGTTSATRQLDSSPQISQKPALASVNGRLLQWTGSDAPQPGPEPPTGTHSQLGPLGRLHWAQQLTVPLVYADAAFDAPALTAAADGGRILFEIADGNTRDRTVVELEGVGLWEAVTPDPEDYIDAFLVPAPALSTVRWRAASAAAPDAGDGRYRIGAWTDWSVLQVPQPEPPSAGVDRAEAP